MDRPVTRESLLHGAVYSLEQCGLLLRDAKLLYETGSYATATAVALFATEERGKWRMLLDLRKRVLAGESFTAADVYVGSHIGSGMMYGMIDKRPAFERYWSLVGSRPAAQRAREIDEELAAAARKAG